MKNSECDIKTIVLDLKAVISYLKVDIRKLLSKDVLYLYQSELYDKSITEAKLIEYLELIDKYGNLENDLKELQIIEVIKRDLNAQFQAIDNQLMSIVRQIHKLRHQAFLLADKDNFINKRQLQLINRKIESLNNKIAVLAKNEKELFEQAFISKEQTINELINKYLINVKDITDDNDMRVIEKVKMEIKFFNSGNFYKHLLETIDKNINSLEIGHITNPLENLDSFIFYTKGLVVACQPKLKKIRSLLQEQYSLYPEYKVYTKGKLKKEYSLIVQVLEALRNITDNLSFITNILNDKKQTKELSDILE